MASGVYVFLIFILFFVFFLLNIEDFKIWLERILDDVFDFKVGIVEGIFEDLRYFLGNKGVYFIYLVGGEELVGFSEIVDG